MSSDVPFKALDVRLAASWKSAVELSPHLTDNLNGIFSYQRFYWYVKYKCSVVADTITKGHHARIADVEVI
jgi:hypothetical protein